jgi:hypothetical protein
MFDDNIDNLSKDIENKGLLRRGESIYYIGTIFFVAGVILLAFGALSIMLFQVHYRSESGLITNTIFYMGTGLIFLTIGINCMIRQNKRSHYIFSIGTILSSIAIALFLLNYENNWYYPMISYVLAIYLSGFLLLIGNAFGNVTLYLINSPGIVSDVKSSAKIEYTDEEIAKDIEEAIQQSLEKSANELEFDVVDIRDLNVAHSCIDSDIDDGKESTTRVKDDMVEINNLKQTIDPGLKDEWGHMGVEKASMQLNKTLTQKSSNKNKGISKAFKGLFSKSKK